MPRTEVSCDPMASRHGPSLASAFSKLSGRKFTYNPGNNTVGVRLPANTVAWIFRDPAKQYRGEFKGDSWAVDLQSETGEGKSFALHLTVDGQLVKLEHSMGTVGTTSQGAVCMALHDASQSGTPPTYAILTPEGDGSKLSEYAKLPGESPWSIQSLRVDRRTAEEKSMPATTGETDFEYRVHEIQGTD
jgi:hypothetical protein